MVPVGNVIAYTTSVRSLAVSFEAKTIYGPIGGHATGGTEEFVEIQSEEKVSDEQVEEHRDEHDGCAQSEEDRARLRHRLEELRSRSHADLSEEHREAEIAQDDVRRERHGPNPPPGTAKPAEDEPHDERPARDAETEGPQPGDRDRKHAEEHAERHADDCHHPDVKGQNRDVQGRFHISCLSIPKPYANAITGMVRVDDTSPYLRICTARNLDAGADRCAEYIRKPRIVPRYFGGARQRVRDGRQVSISILPFHGKISHLKLG